MKNTFYIRLIIFTVFLILLANEILVFEPWNQIKYYMTFNWTNWFNPRAFIKTIPHIPRFTIVYPSYLLKNILGIKINLIYGIYVVSILNLTSILWQRISKYTSNSNIWSFLCSLFPLFLAFIVNGRFAFGLLGITLIIYKAYYRKYNDSINKNFLIEFIGLYLSTVSSGTFFFGLSFFLMTNYREITKSLSYQLLILMQLRFNKESSFKNIFEFFYILLMLILFFMFTIKNFQYYGGFNINGINGLLSHGFGVIFSRVAFLKECTNSNSAVCNLVHLIDVNPIINPFLIILFCIFLYLLFKILRTNNINYFAKLTIIFSLMSGAFGFTAFLSVLVIIPQLRIIPFSKINFNTIQKRMLKFTKF